MKISIGMNLTSGPWGGANRWGQAMKAYLEQNRCTVRFDCRDDDIDIIVLTEPRPSMTSSAYTHMDVQDYLRYRNPNAIVVHRINECDERKGTFNVNNILETANACADHTVFISGWLKELFSTGKKIGKRQSVIRNGADREVFFPGHALERQESHSVGIVTHHWGSDWNKGFDIYQRLDSMLDWDKYRDRIHFTYVGNLPKKFKFRSARHIPPLVGVELANRLRESDVYLTASINEPAGMHHVEGANCGLPLLFINSGGIPEYCQSYGVMYEQEGFERGLDQMLREYPKWRERILQYPYSSEYMCAQYYELFKKLISEREKILAERRVIKKEYPSLGYIGYLGRELGRTLKLR